MIERSHYVDRLLRLRNTGCAKVLTGMRRTGKSGILRLLAQQLLKGGVGPDNLLFINLELIENAPLREPQNLEAYIRSHAATQGVTYLFLDEAQEATDAGKVLYGLLEHGLFDIYLTGSHSKLIERDLLDVMSGRYVEICVFPLSFAEYFSAHPHDAPTGAAKLFQRYLACGGLPHALMLEDDEYALREYLDGVYHTVVRRDVAAGLGYEDPMLVDAIASRLMEALGGPSSANGISKALSSTGRSCSDDTVARYLAALTDSYAFYRMSRYDMKTGMVLKTQERYFASDLGLHALLGGPRGASLTGLLQNVVYLELRRRFDNVYAAKHYNRHIDFVAQDRGGREYFQVVPSVLDPHTLAQTLAPLQAERDNYPKTILTLDEIGLNSHDGIRQVNLLEWLLVA